MRTATASHATLPARGRLSGPLALQCAVLAALVLAACAPRQDPVIEVTGPTMGTYYAVKIPRPPNGLDLGTLRADIEGVLAQVIAEISTYEPGSELSRLNANPSTDWIPVSPDLLSVLAEGQRISALSGGGFDITVGPLVNLWGFGPETRSDSVPQAEQIAAALERVGYQKITLRADPPALRKARGDLYIDLSALGEGYGADRLAAYLDSQGVTDYMVAVAGTIRARGLNAKGQPWGIAVEAPTEGERTVQRVVLLTDGAVSTSGDYRNFFEQGGRRYSHHIDPRTGESVAHRLASATVVMPSGSGNAMSADGLATALVVMGEEKAPALAESSGLAALFILREGEGLSEATTPAFDRIQGR
ncbi:MAG: FAD:protein FMN transferase [Chromatiaceae bacterium]